MRAHLKANPKSIARVTPVVQNEDNYYKSTSSGSFSSSTFSSGDDSEDERKKKKQKKEEMQLAKMKQKGALDSDRLLDKSKRGDKGFK